MVPVSSMLKKPNSQHCLQTYRCSNSAINRPGHFCRAQPHTLASSILGTNVANNFQGPSEIREQLPIFPKGWVQQGEKVTLPKHIVQSFGDYYSSLYNLSDSSLSQTQLNNYLSSARLPCLSSPTAARPKGSYNHRGIAVGGGLSQARQSTRPGWIHHPIL